MSNGYGAGCVVYPSRITVRVGMTEIILTLPSRQLNPNKG